MQLSTLLTLIIFSFSRMGVHWQCIRKALHPLSIYFLLVLKIITLQHTFFVCFFRMSSFDVFDSIGFLKSPLFLAAIGTNEKGNFRMTGRNSTSQRIYLMLNLLQIGVMNQWGWKVGNPLLAFRTLNLWILLRRRLLFSPSFNIFNRTLQHRNGLLLLSTIRLRNARLILRCIHHFTIELSFFHLYWHHVSQKVTNTHRFRIYRAN